MGAGNKDKGQEANMLKNTPNKHAEVMRQAAEDAAETEKWWKRWQWRNPGWENGVWEDCEFLFAFSPYYEYRRKPRTININGHEVPEPYRGGEGTTQCRKHSALEIALNYASGFVIAFIAWQVAAVPLMRYMAELGVGEPYVGFTVTVLFTAVSIVRSYFWRRVFATRVDNRSRGS